MQKSPWNSFGVGDTAKKNAAPLCVINMNISISLDSWLDLILAFYINFDSTQVGPFMTRGCHYSFWTFFGSEDFQVLRKILLLNLQAPWKNVRWCCIPHLLSPDGLESASPIRRQHVRRGATLSGIMIDSQTRNEGIVFGGAWYL